MFSREWKDKLEYLLDAESDQARELRYLSDDLDDVRAEVRNLAKALGYKAHQVPERKRHTTFIKKSPNQKQEPQE